MLSFCGQERCIVDANNRLRLNQRWVEDFMLRCGGDIVMHGLPEGAVALYPEEVYSEMRARELGDVEQIGASFAARRSLRRFGALTMPEKISRQGRITLPGSFLKFAGLSAGDEACIVGVEIGLEIWSPRKFELEMDDTALWMEGKRQQELSTGTGKSE